MTHPFTATIIEILQQHFGSNADVVFKNSPLLQYINIKTKSATRGSKSRSAFGNHYAIYVLVEDYVNKNFDESESYEDYEGAQFTALFRRQRELPFGQKLQNHALNHRLNEEFKKYNPTMDVSPIIRDTSTNRYWFNENLLLVDIEGEPINIAKALLAVIDAYVAAKKSAFEGFIAACQKMAKLDESEHSQVQAFVMGLVQPNVDARVFEIVSFAILKAHYGMKSMFWGWSRDSVQEEALVLYKTGRTNANDGGIDFVMKPLGRFFQVTETVDASKYFLDIDKVQRFPITFIVKTQDSQESLQRAIRDQAKRRYRVTMVVDRYMDCVEETINIPALKERLAEVIKDGYLPQVIMEIVKQSRLEFNYEEE